MTRAGRWILVAVAGVLLALGLLTGLADRSYSAYPERPSCGSVLAGKTFIVSDADDPLVDEAARCAALIGRHAPQVWTMLGASGVLLVVAFASLGGTAPTRRRTEESEPRPGRS